MYRKIFEETLVYIAEACAELGCKETKYFAVSYLGRSVFLLSFDSAPVHVQGTQEARSERIVSTCRAQLTFDCAGKATSLFVPSQHYLHNPALPP